MLNIFKINSVFEKDQQSGHTMQELYHPICHMSDMKPDGGPAPGDLVGLQEEENTSQYFPHSAINASTHEVPHVQTA